MAGGGEAKLLTNLTIPSKRTILSFPPTIVFSNLASAPQISIPRINSAQMAGSGHLKTSSPVDLDGMPRWRFPPFQMSIGWPEGNGCRHRRMRIVPWSRWRSPWNQAITLSLPLPVPCTLDFRTLRRGHSIDPGLVFCAARPLSFFRCCTRSLDVRLVFFAEYKVPPNESGSKDDSRSHESYARGSVYFRNWTRAWMAACEEGVDGWRRRAASVQLYCF
ncbi:hypothetical protein B0H14DRAFT_2556657 [Mycena olivaceomarginata]|nr:hypothetical protein B0H14DRAFT_2556657 [Mycena olivaceomarginata]